MKTPMAHWFVKEINYRVASVEHVFVVQSVPPQSTPASFPFWTRSSHVGARQRPFEHTPLVQSAGSAHSRVTVTT